VLLQQLGNGEYRPDAHLIRFASSHLHATVRAERL